jgi:hypothetical protein
VNKIKLIIAGSGVIFVVLAGMYFVLSSDEDKFPPPLSPDYVEEYPIYVSATPAENTGNVPTPTLPAHEVTSSTNEKPVVIENPVVDATMSKEEFFEIISGTTTPLEKIDTSDWKTYRDDEYGFEISYPPDVVLSVEPQKKLDGVFLYFPHFMSLGVVNNKTIQDRLLERNPIPKTVTITTDIGELVSLYQPSPTQTISLVLEHQNTLYNFDDAPGLHSEMLPFFLAVIESLRFIENE